MKSFRKAADFACVAAPKLVGGACLVVLNIGLMNWLGPDSYGTYAICLATLSLLSEGLFGAAIDMGVVRLAPLHLLTDPSRAMRIEKAALDLKVQVVGGLSLILILGSVPLSQLVFHGAGDWYLIILTCAAALGVLCLSSALLHFQIRGHFFRYGLLDALQILVKFGGIAVVLYCVDVTHQSLRLGHVLVWFAISPIVACGCFFVFKRGTLSHLPIDTGGQSRKELIGFIKWFLLTLLVSSAISRVDVFLLTAFCSIEDVGLYAAGQTIAMIPVLLGLYLSVISSPRVMPYCRAGKFWGLLCRVQALLIVVSVMGYAVLLWNGQFITEYLLPGSFASSSRVIFILLPATLAGMTSFPLTVPFLMFLRPRFLVTVDLILLPFLLVAYLRIVPDHGAIGAAFVTSAFGILKTVIAQGEAFRWARKSPSEMGLCMTDGTAETENDN